jgi:hypothetical protein
MRCPHCESDNLDGSKFCVECGIPLRSHCPRCGADTLPRAKFCGECGAPLTGPPPASSPVPPQPPLSYIPVHLAEKILHSKGALEGERKQITVLFADLKGSMELLADRDPEEARQILDPVLERMMEAVHRYEGTVNQVMGDGIMALFGAPIAHEDHAVRTCPDTLAVICPPWPDALRGTARGARCLAPGPRSRWYRPRPSHRGHWGARCRQDPSLLRAHPIPSCPRMAGA